MSSSELCGDVLNCSRLSPAPETSTITDSFAARLGPSVLDRARPPRACGYHGMSKKNIVTMLWITIQCPHRQRKVQTMFRLTTRYAGSVVPAKPSASGIHVTSFQSNMECDVCISKNSYANVVLSSGTNLFLEVFERHDEGTDGVSSICDVD